MSGAFSATGTVFRRYLHNARPVSILLVALPFVFAFGAAYSNASLLQTPDALAAYIAENQNNALLGAIAANTVEAATIWRIRLSAALILSILSIVLVIGDTRKEEDQGTLELIRAGAVGCVAPLTAALIKVFLANLSGGVFMAAGFLSAHFPIAGSFTAGLSIALCSVFFASIAAVAAQLAPNARLARGLSFGTVVFFLLLLVAANTVKVGGMLLLSPFGWCAYAKPYAGENYMLFGVAAFVILILVYTAYLLNRNRDLGFSYIHEASVKACGGKWFCSLPALAWRQQKGMLLVWVAAYTLIGFIIGQLKPGIDKMFGGSNFLPDLSAVVGGPGQAFLEILSYILTQVVTAYAIMAILRMREEEASARADWLLSKPTSRINFATGHICFAYFGSAAAIGLLGICSGTFLSCVARIPAVWIVSSVVVCVYSLFPRLSVPVGWGLVGTLLALEFLWEMRFVPTFLFRLSPFAWIYPGTPVSLCTALAMLTISAILLFLGLFFFSKRDLTTR